MKTQQIPSKSFRSPKTSRRNPAFSLSPNSQPKLIIHNGIIPIVSTTTHRGPTLSTDNTNLTYSYVEFKIQNNQLSSNRPTPTFPLIVWEILPKILPQSLPKSNPLPKLNNLLSSQPKSQKAHTINDSHSIWYHLIWYQNRIIPIRTNQQQGSPPSNTPKPNTF